MVAPRSMILSASTWALRRKSNDWTAAIGCVEASPGVSLSDRARWSFPLDRRHLIVFR